MRWLGASFLTIVFACYRVTIHTVAIMSDVLTSSVVRSPIGLIKLKVSGLGVQEITLDREFDSKVSSNNFNEAVVGVEQIEGPDSKTHKRVIKWLEAFFDTSKPQQTAPPIDNPVVSKDNFTGLVLRTLVRETAPGGTVSYAGLADLCGNPKACRAVGQAMRTNPVPLVVPCHRVVASNGGLGHYMSGKGDNIKKWLLALEKVKSQA